MSTIIMFTDIMIKIEAAKWQCWNDLSTTKISNRDTDDRAKSQLNDQEFSLAFLETAGIRLT